MIVFGYKDLEISDECNLNYKSNSSLGFTYELPNGLQYNTE